MYIYVYTYIYTHTPHHFAVHQKLIKHCKLPIPPSPPPHPTKVSLPCDSKDWGEACLYKENAVMKTFPG